MVFQGSSALTLDAKGRISIPTRHRDALVSQVEGRLTLTRHPDGCLLLYPRPVWEKKREQIAAFPMTARPLQRLLLGNAQDVDIDGSGRVLVAPELREAAGMTRDVKLLGLGDYFELWDVEAWERHKAKTSQNMANILSNPSLSQFSF